MFLISIGQMVGIKQKGLDELTMHFFQTPTINKFMQPLPHLSVHIFRWLLLILNKLNTAACLGNLRSVPAASVLGISVLSDMLLGADKRAIHFNAIHKYHCFEI